MDHWKDKPSQCSDPKAERSPGMDFDWSGDKWAGFPSCMQTCISMANLVNFRRARPCQSLMEYTGGYCCCCRSSLLSLRWANVDPPVELKADHTFPHLQGDYLSLQWHRTPLGQTNTRLLSIPWIRTGLSRVMGALFWSKRVPAGNQSAHDITRDRWKLWPTCPLANTMCDEKVTTCLWHSATNVTWR